jgi:predicted NUDIX family phosphoesterase
MKGREHILCFKTEVLNELGRFQGISFDVSNYFPKIINKPYCQYIPREKAECDENFKQIIPYAIFINKYDIFTYRRGKRGGEQRLHEQYSVGIGGHIEATDVTLFSTDYVGYGDSLLREISEEVDIACSFREACVALLNDDSNGVGRVHFGLVHLFLLEGREIYKNESSITNAALMPIDKALKNLDRFEAWSQLCLENIDRLLEQFEVSRSTIK